MRRTSSAMAFLLDEFIGLGRVAFDRGRPGSHSTILSTCHRRDHLRRAPTASQGGTDDGGDIDPRGSATSPSPIARDTHDARDAPATPAFVPRYYKFESVSLQGRDAM